MSVFINGEEISGEYVTNFQAYVNGLVLSGIVLGEEVKKIHFMLSKYKEGDIIKIDDYITGKYSRNWRVTKIDLQINDENKPLKLRFGLGFTVATR